jgi:hypothetical protein
MASNALTRGALSPVLESAGSSMTTTDSQNAERTRNMSLPFYKFCGARFSALLHRNLHEGLENPVRAVRRNCFKFYPLPAVCARSVV